MTSICVGAGSLLCLVGGRFSLCWRTSTLRKRQGDHPWFWLGHVVARQAHLDGQCELVVFLVVALIYVLTPVLVRFFGVTARECPALRLSSHGQSAQATGRQAKRAMQPEVRHHQRYLAQVPRLRPKTPHSGVPCTFRLRFAR